MQQEIPEMDYDHFLARRVKAIKTSATIAINEKATRMRARGVDAYPNVSKLYGSKYGDQVITDSVGFCAYILDETQVALVPGLAFGTDDFVRISYATSMENIKTGMGRIKLALEKLKGQLSQSIGR